MAITLGQSVTKTKVTGNSTTATMPAAITAGSGLTAACSAWRGGSVDPNVTYSDSVNGAYTRDRNAVDGFFDSVSIASFPNTGAGTPVMTYTMSAGSGTGVFGVADFREWVNLATATHTDTGGTNTGSSTTPTTATTATLAQADEVCIAISADGSGGATDALTENQTGTVGTFTLSVENEDGSTNIHSGIVYQIVAATTALKHVWSIPGSSPWATAIQTYKGSGGGAATTRGRPFGQRGNAFNGGRTFFGIIDG